MTHAGLQNEHIYCEGYGSVCQRGVLTYESEFEWQTSVLQCESWGRWGSGGSWLVVVASVTGLHKYFKFWFCLGGLVSVLLVSSLVILVRNTAGFLRRKIELRLMCRLCCVGSFHFHTAILVCVAW
jgi:hypothetical protein